jgi:hypothetical protein
MGMRLLAGLKQMFCLKLSHNQNAKTYGAPYLQPLSDRGKPHKRELKGNA